MPTFTSGFTTSRAYEFASPCINFRRNLASPGQGFTTDPVFGFGDTSIHYRRTLATPGQGFEAGLDYGMADPHVQLPKVRGIYIQAILVDLKVAPFLPGDTGAELIYNIPNKLGIRPHLIAPPFGSRHRLGTPIMIWTPTVEADFYEVHVARDVEFTQRIARVNTTASQIQAGFPFGGTYFWKVRAVNDAGAYSDYSEVWTFTVPDFAPAIEGEHEADGVGRLLNQFRQEV